MYKASRLPVVPELLSESWTPTYIVTECMVLANMYCAHCSMFSSHPPLPEDTSCYFNLVSWKIYIV